MLEGMGQFCSDFCRERAIGDKSHRGDRSEDHYDNSLGACGKMVT